MTVADVGNAIVPPIIATASAGLRAISSPFGAFTLLCCGLGIVAFYGADWSELQVALAASTGALFRATDHVVAQHLQGVRVDTFWVTMTAECTYIDWILIAGPFVWRRGPVWVNIARSLILVGAVTLVNFARVWLSVAGVLWGFSWFWSHDLVDDILWYPSLVVMIILWMAAAQRSSEDAVAGLRHAATNERCVNNG